MICIYNIYIKIFNTNIKRIYMQAIKRLWLNEITK